MTEKLNLINEMDATKRQLVEKLMKGICVLSLSDQSIASNIKTSAIEIANSTDPYIFCIAYIDPKSDLSNGQIETIAKYPLAIVPQDDRKHYVDWKNSIKASNNNIKLYAYQMTVEETTVPGPGHRRLSMANGEWVKYAGIYPVSKYKSRRFFDPRSKVWQKAFLKGVMETLASYPYDGIFLDQCAIFGKMAPIQSIRSEMDDALQHTLSILRQEVGDTVTIIANSLNRWNNIDGQMIESLPENMKTYIGHKSSERKSLYFHYLNNSDYIEAERLFDEARTKNLCYGCAPNAQTVIWPSFFEKYSSNLI